MKRAIAFMVLAGALSPAFAQERAKEASPVKIEEAIAVDGTLDEPAWQKAGDLTDFVQFQPNRGASVRTVILCRYICFGSCYDASRADRQPRDQRATSRRMTPVHRPRYPDDQRTCLCFITNILGRYAAASSTTGTRRWTWDGVASAGRRTDFG
jgi:hypothetical protein